MIGKALDLRDVFFFALHGVGVNSHCREFAATTMFLSSAAPGTLLVVLVLLRVGGGNLLSRK